MICRLSLKVTRSDFLADLLDFFVNDAKLQVSYISVNKVTWQRMSTCDKLENEDDLLK